MCRITSSGTKATRTMFKKCFGSFISTRDLKTTLRSGLRSTTSNICFAIHNPGRKHRRTHLQSLLGTMSGYSSDCSTARTPAFVDRCRYPRQHCNDLLDRTSGTLNGAVGIAHRRNDRDCRRRALRALRELYLAPTAFSRVVCSCTGLAWHVERCANAARPRWKPASVNPVQCYDPTETLFRKLRTQNGKSGKFEFFGQCVSR